MRSPRSTSIHILLSAIIFFITTTAHTADLGKDEDAPAPHTPTLIFYLTGLDGRKDTDAITTSIQKLKTAGVIEVNLDHGYARVRFDSHVVSYHQVAQVIADAGKSLGKNYDPYLIFTVPDYAKAENTAKVDQIFAGKRLNQRVSIKPWNKSAGEFQIHFLQLQVDSRQTAPQGFNGGHLHHPISDPPPRGLGLPSGYADKDDRAPTSQPSH